MKFRIANLGRIRSAELQIKPLTVFVGKANTNKTWTAYSLYSILRELSPNPPDAVAPIECRQLDETIEETADLAIDRVLELAASAPPSAAQVPARELMNMRAAASIASVDIFRDEVLRSLTHTGDTITFSIGSRELAKSLAVHADVLPEASAQLEISTHDLLLSGKMKSLTLGWTGQNWILEAYSSKGRITYISHFMAALSASKGASDTSRSQLKRQVLPAVRRLVEAIFDGAMAFPSERKGLHALNLDSRRTSWQPDSRENRLSRAALDYIERLSIYEFYELDDSVAELPVVALLERSILGGTPHVRTKAEGKSTIFEFVGRNGPTVQINASASFVRSLAGLDLYLRTAEGPGVIVIDEPEMNAHPEAQLKLVELFALMANQGWTIVVTTHSPYFLDHLNNLMQGFQLPESARQQVAEDLKLKEASAFISEEKVSAYLFNEDGKIDDLVSEGTIDVGSFASETDFLSDIYSRIRSARRASSNAE